MMSRLAYCYLLLAFNAAGLSCIRTQERVTQPYWFRINEMSFVTDVNYSLLRQVRRNTHIYYQDEYEDRDFSTHQNGVINGFAADYFWLVKDSLVTSVSCYAPMAAYDRFQFWSTDTLLIIDLRSADDSISKVYNFKNHELHLDWYFTSSGAENLEWELKSVSNGPRGK